MTIKNVLLRASAGTGKTFQLSNRYILLILAGTSPDKILATTFTRKAAGEILTRIFTRLAAATTSETLACELCGELKIAPTSARQFGAALLFLASRLHRINVSTLDAYFAKLLTNHAYEFDIGADWSIATSGEQAAQKQHAIIELIRQLSDTDSSRLMRFINKGKYHRSILHSLENTITNLVFPFYQSTAIAWKNDLGGESGSRLLNAEQVSAAVSAIVNQTDNHEWAPFLKTINTDLVTLRANDWDNALRGGLFKKILAGDYKFSRKQLPDSLVDAYLPLTEHVIALKVLELDNQTQATFTILSHYVAILDQIKRKSKRLEFNDVTRLLNRGRPGIESTFRMDGTIDHLLLDEFQDTSLPQWNIVEPLALTITNESDGSFFCVGDVKQAIYGWRGGRREIFDKLESSLNDVSTSTLEHSYRSSKVIVDFVNNVFNNLTAHPNPRDHAETLRSWQADFVPLIPVLEHDGYVEYVNSDVGIDKSERLESCLSLAVDKTEMLLAANRKIEIGILVRTNESIAMIIHLLAARGIASSEDGGNPLSNYSAVQLIIAALSLIEHPADSISQFHVSHSPLAHLFGYDTESANANTACTASSAFRRKIAVIGFAPVLTSLVLALEPHVDRVQFTRLEHLLVFADSFTFTSNFRLDEFIEALKNERFSDPEASRVRVMTIHQSKGLEFDAVILPTLDSTLSPRAPTYAVTRNPQTQEITDVFMYRNSQFQELLPSRYSDACKNTIAESVSESLCVLYVALTRAARALYLIGPCQPKTPKLPPLTNAGIIQISILNEYSQTPNQVVYEAGNPMWFEQLPIYDPTPSKSLVTLPVPLTGVSTSKDTALQSAAPSSLEGGDRFKLSGVLRSSSDSALLLGNQLHFFMEQIDWSGDTSWEAANDTFTSKYGVVSPELQSHLSMFLENAPLAVTLNIDFYFDHSNSPLNELDCATKETTVFTVNNEFPICASIDGDLLRGFIDRLVIMRVDERIVAVDICDYKTDRINNNAGKLQASVSHYRPQIAAYRNAIAQMFALEPLQIGARLIFTHAGVQIPV
jgi:ATP-dependent exoDNAse (exonuclease V) beta subunit